MAMTMNGEVQLAAPREVVWAKLNDAEVLKQCIPGCEELNKTSDTGFSAVATIKIGPVKARFKGRVQLSDMDPPNGYKISGEGEGGVAGFAKGGAVVKLTDKDGGTLLTLRRRVSDRRQARPTRTAAGAGHREEARRRFLQQVRRGGDGLIRPAGGADTGPFAAAKLAGCGSSAPTLYSGHRSLA